ncbi:CLUMA_CG008888, isoform A [Clunio marinus]|uniref:CLUMA_CG008888, isoform A n=1 Tax=Clunio marinus TaxID=568069 RepID=A0A1J1I658_9DIPT|nr:CLUMA_CG008888, isoform A [Clunio marinus]
MTSMQISPREIIFEGKFMIQPFHTALHSSRTLNKVVVVVVDSLLFTRSQLYPEHTITLSKSNH